MSAEIEGFLGEIDFLLADLRETLHSTNNFNPEDRAAKLNRCAHCIQGIRTGKEAAVLEARRLTNADEKAEVQDALKRRMHVFKELYEAYEYKKGEIDRDQLQAEADSYDDFGQTNQTQALIQRGDAIQDQTQAAIANMAALAEDAEDIGGATALKMDQQIEQMQKIGQGLDDVQFNTKRAQKTAAQMARGAASDLCIQILCGGIAICLITIIVLVSV